MKYIKRRKNTIVIFIIIIGIITSCVSSKKYKKHKAMPCPCEKESRRQDFKIFF